MTALREEIYKLEDFLRCVIFEGSFLVDMVKLFVCSHVPYVVG